MRNRPIPGIALEFIKQWYAISLTAYKNSDDIWTIGYGHTSRVKLEDIITQAQADAFLKQDLFQASRAIIRLTDMHLNDFQYTALLSLVFNISIGAYQRSTLRQVINRGKLSKIKGEFIKWSKDHLGHTQKSLLKRRRAEARWFMKDVPTAQLNDSTIL
jgi:lysozyme